MRILAALLLFEAVSAFTDGVVLNDEVLVHYGIPYAEPPIGEKRFTKSEPIALPEGGIYTKAKDRCIYNVAEDGKSEDCLYFNIFKHKDTTKKLDTLLIITNAEVKDEKIAGLVRKDLQVVVASVRDGVLGSFGNAPYGASDVESLVKFLKTNAEKLNVGKITVWAEGSVAETVAAAQRDEDDIERVVLINGNAITRTYEREKYQKLATYKLRTVTECDLPSFDQSVDCLRTKPIEELMEKAQSVVKSFYPFGNPFRAPRGYVSEKAVPSILGLYKYLPPEYPTDANFDSDYKWETFKKFLAGLVPDSLHNNAPLLRRLITHQYVHSTGSKKNNYHLFQMMVQILIDRDYHVPMELLIDHYKTNKRKLWVLEYGIGNHAKDCLKDDLEDVKPFCDRLFQYITRFATKGAPTENSCDHMNPTFPMMGSSKRDYHVVLNADGVPDWQFGFYQPACQLWNHLLPSMDMLELVGRRDAIFKEEIEVDPLEVEDDIQMWHERAHEDTTVLTEEKVMNDMPYKADNEL